MRYYSIIIYTLSVAEVRSDGDFWNVTSFGRGIQRITHAREIIDCTGDCDVVRLLKLPVLKGDIRQPGSYQYKIEGIKHEQIWEKEVQVLYEEAIDAGVLKKGDYAYPNILPFKSYLDHGGHNSTHIYNADTSDADGQTLVNIEGRERMLRMFKFLRSTIPGCERAVISDMASHGLSRETSRIDGEYRVTREDFLNATDFDDKICNAFNYIDMHSESIGCELFFHSNDRLLPKVPFRALIPKHSSRITVAGRILSAEPMALAGIRAQCTCMAMGQAMGAAAALAVKKKIPSRDIDSKDIVSLTIEHGAVDI